MSNRKKCSKCQKWKVYSNFSSDASRADGHQNSCKECQNPGKPGTKWCVGCKKNLPLSSFQKNAKMKDGLQIYHRECQIEKMFTGYAKKLLCDDKCFLVYEPSYFRSGTEPYQIVINRTKKGKISVKIVKLEK